MTEDEIKQLIDAEIQRITAFSYRKLGDTPTDAQQLTPKGYVDQQITSRSTSFSGTGLFGDGSDGVALFDGTSSVSGASIIGFNINAQQQYNITRSVFFNAASISSGVIVYPLNNRIFSKVAITNSGSVLANGGAGGKGSNGANGVAPNSGSGGGGGGTGGNSVTGGWFVTLPGTNGGGGGTGGKGTANSADPSGTGAGPVATNTLSALIVTSSITSGTGANGGDGGVADAFGGRNGGGKGSVATATQYTSRPTTPFYWEGAYDLKSSNPFAVSVFTALPNGGGAGGGGGGTNAVNAAGGGGGGGGGSGGNGGIIMIVSPTIVNNGLIQAKGGIGGDGGNGGNGDRGGSTAAGGGGGGGAGAGGSGGVFFYVANSYTNNGVVDVSGGAHSSVGGTGGAASGNGSAGTNGATNAQDGTAGLTYGILI